MALALLALLVASCSSAGSLLSDSTSASGGNKFKAFASASGGQKKRFR
ncbi:MAG TPA: hypothetical protein PKH78_06105 [Candidatus Obscuribacter sp.]|nr:hypothetical protein [Candidatus Obscuribacter sp.]